MHKSTTANLLTTQAVRVGIALCVFAWPAVTGCVPRSGRAASPMTAAPGNVTPVPGACDDPRLSPSERADRLTRSAQLRIKRGDLSGADRELYQALRVAPGWVPALLTRGQLRLDDNDLDGAERDFANVLEIDGASCPAQAGLAQVRCRQGRFDEGIRLLSTVIEQAPRDVELRRLRAEAYVSQALVLVDPVDPEPSRRAAKAAARDLSVAVAEQPNNPDWLLQRARARALDKDRFALDDVSRAVALARHPADRERYRRVGDEVRSLLLEEADIPPMVVNPPR